MIRDNRIPLVVLAVVLVAGYAIPRLFIAGETALLEADSDRLGWGAPADAEAVARDIYERINDERQARGLPVLRWHDDLAALAGDWSAEMLASGYRHSTAEFREHPDFAGSGENIAMGQSSSTELHVAWMRSDGHRDNILFPDFTDVGIGIVCRNDGRMWATQIFGVRHGAAVSEPVPTSVEPIVGDGRGGVSCPRDPFELFPFQR